MHRATGTLALIGLLTGTAALRAGTLEGHVTAQGIDLPAETTGDDPYASRKYRFLERIDYEALTDFVVWLEGGPPAPPLATGTTVRVVTQKSGTFEPHVMPVRVGTQVEWPNEDDIFHNVFSLSEAKRFNLGLYKMPDVKKETFGKPGRVDVFCSIHKNMHCIILVLETPWFGVTDSRGRYTLRDVPAGTYQLKAWHERLPPQTREITIPASGTIRADVVLGVTGMPED